MDTGSTAKTYTDLQIGERGRELVMKSASMLIAALNTQAINPDRISALSEALHAGMSMVEFGPGPDDVP